ncbi:MAG TPA: DUF5916 domain-containing protein, partial [Blastocatellia bacterium]|nr:DUF5916 domain-containing protein [Blastocatellia bacterium]
MRHGAIALILLFVSLPVRAQTAQPPVTSPAVESKAAPRKGVPKADAKPNAARPAIALPPEKANPVSIPRFEKAPVIDGRLDDDIWKQAVVFKDFYQTNPGDNIAPSKPTEAMMGYDSKRLYFAFHAYDEPDKIRATIAKRDEIFGEDNIRVFLDTFNDKRKAYVLGFNPFGIQQDGVMSEGGEADFNVDIVMESKGVLTEDGYTIEVAIPFKSLRYEAGKGKLWGIHIWRNIDRFDDEIDSWMPLSREEASNLKQAGHITGLEGISTERTLELIPTLTISEEGRRVRTLPLSAVMNDPSLRDPGRFINKNVKLDPGLTFKLSITPNVTLDFAANPDFAQVEADQTVVTANQRFPIFFAEKRPFFLEGADIFRTPIQAVHTRAIVDPDYAVKLSGKQGRNSFGLLLATDHAPGNFSEEEINDPEIFSDISKFIDKNAYIGVLRLKRDFGRENTLGLIATTYNFIERHNHLLGFDGRFKLDPKTTLSFQVLGTNTRACFFSAAADPAGHAATEPCFVGQTLVDNQPVPFRTRNFFRTGNAFAYRYSFDRSWRNSGININ